MAWSFFFFQAEDGIRDHCVTGVQTCALPIFGRLSDRGPSDPVSFASFTLDKAAALAVFGQWLQGLRFEIGRASCRERGETADRAGHVINNQLYEHSVKQEHKILIEHASPDLS